MRLTESSIQLPGAFATTCPYESKTGHSCAASVMTVITSTFQKTTYCWTDDYDHCPMFLAKVLRGS